MPFSHRENTKHRERNPENFERKSKWRRMYPGLSAVSCCAFVTWKYFPEILETANELKRGYSEKMKYKKISWTGWGWCGECPREEMNCSSSRWRNDEIAFPHFGWWYCLSSPLAWVFTTSWDSNSNRWFYFLLVVCLSWFFMLCARLRPRLYYFI